MILRQCLPTAKVATSPDVPQHTDTGLRVPDDFSQAGHLQAPNLCAVWLHGSAHLRAEAAAGCEPPPFPESAAEQVDVPDRSILPVQHPPDFAVPVGSLRGVPGRQVDILEAERRSGSHTA